MSMQYFHAGIVVENIEQAMDELGRSLGLTWEVPYEREYDGAKIRVSYSHQGPPFIELIEGAPGSGWDTSNGSRLDHLGYYSADFEADVSRLESEGLPVDVDGVRLGGRFTYHRTQHSGLRVELIDSNRPGPKRPVTPQ